MNKSTPFFLLFSYLSILVLSDEITIDPTNPTTPPFLNIQLNMTGTGFWTAYYPSQTKFPNEDSTLTFTSKWMQYDTNKTLYLNIGNSDLGDQSCLYEWWFVESKHYVVTYANSQCSGPITCECITGFGYDEEIQHYNSTYLGYLGRSYSYKFGREVDSYSGTVIDSVGPLTVVAYVGTSDGSYVGMTTINTQQTGINPYDQYFNEYFYDKIQMVPPPSSYFEIPKECKQVEKELGCTPYSQNVNPLRKILSINKKMILN